MFVISVRLRLVVKVHQLMSSIEGLGWLAMCTNKK